MTFAQENKVDNLGALLVRKVRQCPQPLIVTPVPICNKCLRLLIVNRDTRKVTLEVLPRKWGIAAKGIPIPEILSTAPV